MSDDEDPIGSGDGFDNAGGVFGGNEGEEDNGKMESSYEHDTCTVVSSIAKTVNDFVHSKRECL